MRTSYRQIDYSFGIIFAILDYIIQKISVSYRRRIGAKHFINGHIVQVGLPRKQTNPLTDTNIAIHFVTVKCSHWCTAMKTYKYSKLEETKNTATDEACNQKGSIFSRVTFGWLDETIEHAKDGSLNEHNLGEVLDMKSTEEITDRLQDEWKREMDKASSEGKRPRLWKAVQRSVDRSVITQTFFFGIVDSTGRILQTVFLSLILSELALGTHANMISLCLYASSILIFCLLENMSRNEQYHHEVLTAVQIRAALTGLIQRKVRYRPRGRGEGKKFCSFL